MNHLVTVQGIKQYLDHVPILQFPKLDANVKQRLRARLSEEAVTVTFQKGTVIASGVLPVEGLLLIEEGNVRCVKLQCSAEASAGLVASRNSGFNASGARMLHSRGMQRNASDPEVRTQGRR